MSALGQKRTFVEVNWGQGRFPPGIPGTQYLIENAAPSEGCAMRKRWHQSPLRPASPLTRLKCQLLRVDVRMLPFPCLQSQIQFHGDAAGNQAGGEKENHHPPADPGSDRFAAKNAQYPCGRGADSHQPLQLVHTDYIRVHLLRAYSALDRPTKSPRRAPNCGAPTPTPVPSRISYTSSSKLITSNRAVSPFQPASRGGRPDS